jgi:hypothetical protein
MDRPEHNGADFFVGTEVEHSPAYGMKTLFVIGAHDPQAVLEKVAERQSYTDKSKHIEHIYFGANMSFPNPDINNGEVWNQWETMIGACLMHGYWCTLDIDVTAAEGLLEGTLIDHARFIPMISVKLPYAKLYNYNTTIKIDDKDFQATNDGVWCHSLHDLRNRRVFTDWSKYSKDEVIT